MRPNAGRKKGKKNWTTFRGGSVHQSKQFLYQKKGFQYIFFTLKHRVHSNPKIMMAQNFN